MKKPIFLLLFLVLVAVPALIGFDWGGSLTNTTGIRPVVSDPTVDVEFLQSNSLSLWMKINFDEFISFQTKASYLFSLERPLFGDLDTFYLSAKALDIVGGPAKFDLKLGRFNLNDPTGNILAHRIDGGRFVFSWERAVLDSAFGYTGLFFKPNSNILVSKADVAALSDPSPFFASPRFIGMLNFKLPDLFFQQNFAFFGLFQQDLRPGDGLVQAGETDLNASVGGHVDTQYLGTRIDGRIVSFLYYDLFYVFNLGRTLSYLTDATSPSGNIYTYTPIQAHMAGLGFTLFFEEFLRSRIRLRGMFSTGDEDYSAYIEGNTADVAGQFTPISRITKALIFSPSPGNSTEIEIDYSLKPFAGLKGSVLERFQAELRGFFFFRTLGTAPVSEAGLDPASDAAYLGTEVDLLLNFRPFSDLGLSLNTGLFFPNAGSTGAFPDDTKSVNFSMSLYASLSY